ncbi:MAG: glycosyltransferase family 2 protein, partial [bacterium]|nr:glycosyltransferase family 2 protein [bacterium]
WIGRPKHYELPYSLVARGPVGLHPHPTSSVEVSTCGRSMGDPRARHPSLSYHPLTYLSGCCLAIKRQVFEKIGLFDEKYFLYFEDLDFCLRAKKAGFKIALEPKVVIFHKLGGSAGRWSKTAIFHNLRSNFIFITKHLGWRRPIGYLYLTALSIKIMIDKAVK